jgi:hypothetical protein
VARVPKPALINDESAGYNHWIGTGRDPDEDRAGYIVGTAHHTSQGYFGGNQVSFDNPSYGGLTDFQVGGPWDGDMDGVIMQFIADTAPIIPWANGTVGAYSPPYGDAPAFLNAYGIDGVNRRLRSIETTDGVAPDRDKGGRQIESLCFLTAWIHSEQAGQTAETFQWNMHHCEFGVDHQQCPGAWIKNNVVYIQARTKAIMLAYHTDTPLETPLLITYPPNWQGGVILQPGEGVTPKPVPDPKPKPSPKPIVTYPKRLPPPPWNGKDAEMGKGHVWRAIDRVVTTTDKAPRLQTAGPNAREVGPDLKENESFAVKWVERGGRFIAGSKDPANRLYYVTVSGTRVPMILCTPHVDFEDAA